MTAKPCLSSVPCTQLAGVGTKVAEKLAGLGIQSVQDVLFHLPRSYQDRTTIIPINRVTVGMQQLVQGEILSAQVIYGRRISLLVNLSDGAGLLTLRFFHFSHAMKTQLSQVGGILRCFGEIRFGSKGLEMVHPEYQRVDSQTKAPLSSALTPVYPLTEGLGQVMLRSLVAKALVYFASHGALQEYLPDFIRHQYGFASLEEALQFVHNPPLHADTKSIMNGNHPAVQRLSFEELLAHQLVMIQSREIFRRQQAQALKQDDSLRQQLVKWLGFDLTDAQKRVIKEIDADLNQSVPMMRLLQGDVGCGKTVVAAMIICRALASGKQAALMAPTEILMKQHFNAFFTVVWKTDIKVRFFRRR